MKNILIITLLLLATISSVSGQSTSTFRERLSLPDATHNSRIVVTEQGDAGSIIKMMESSKSLTRINGYRVRIFFDNSQNARGAAAAAMSRFKEMFPDIPVYMNYENPYFKVTAGNCVTNEEAIILWGKLKGVFATAFPIREEFSITELTQ